MAEAGGVPRGEWSGREGRAPARGTPRGSAGPAQLPRELVAQPCLPPATWAALFLAASVAKKKKWSWEGARSLEWVLGWRDSLWESLWSPVSGMSHPRLPGPPPGAVCSGGLLWTQGTPPLAQGP